ncbi:hypothetical protein ACL02R_25895 [Streptomyces sp. MS19]|uniref:hypothetical protein n=1 Tax=Streptomyces sp. MS19 TaxID=3385972 RepID=UPI0039A272C8
MAPNETVVGAQVAATLGALRADPSEHLTRHPEYTFRTVPDRLAEWQAAGADTAVFHGGRYAARCRFAELGLSHLLPLARMLVGAESRREAFACEARSLSLTDATGETIAVIVSPAVLEVLEDALGLLQGERERRRGRAAPPTTEDFRAELNGLTTS